MPICRLDKSNSNKAPSLKLKLVISFSVVCGLVLVISIAYFLLHSGSRETKTTNNSISEPAMRISSLRLSYGDLSKATDGFSSTNFIGAGSFGSVYKGVLDMEQSWVLVAIKVLNLQSSKASKSFVSECEALRGIRHRNLVKLLTACSSLDFHGNEFKALIYDFMANGSLEEWLHQDHKADMEQEQSI